MHLFINNLHRVQNYIIFAEKPVHIMENRKISESELVIAPDSSIYHLRLKPGDVANTIILVGDPGRVELVSSFFDSLEVQINNREFATRTGYYKNKRLSVISTGIGTDNIDIVLNELDALFNIDFQTRTRKKEISQLHLIRLGTSGLLHKDINPGKTILSEFAGGLDNVLYFYKGVRDVINKELGDRFSSLMARDRAQSEAYFVPASGQMTDIFKNISDLSGITLSAPGFYAPQGRSLRLPLFDDDYLSKIKKFQYESLRILNFEMESSALYGLATLLGHHAVSLCIGLANRTTGKFVTDYKPIMHEMVANVLNQTLELPDE
mgnify:FL=1